ncbi:C40 family peptidase [Salinithrix halophila]|uniref:C40 family peptidase n=1 Tax=Salinithrix halophila TaxID=1485204 RepID=A0ABV8JG88_9BACL
MFKTNILKKVVVFAAAFALVGTASPLAGSAHAASNQLNANQMVQDIFAKVLAMQKIQKSNLPSKGAQQTASADNQSSAGSQQSAPAADQSSAGSQQSAPAADQSSAGSQQSTPAADQSSAGSQQSTPAADQSSAGSQQSTPAADQSSDFGDRIIATGEKYLGTPYKFGAKSGQTNTFDCSSFTQYVFGQNGVKLPRTAEPQAEVGTEVPRSQMKKGDLVFFKLKGREHLGIEHVGIYAGNGKLLHTWGPGGVRYDDMSDRWLDWGFVKATRVQP